MNSQRVQQQDESVAQRLIAWLSGHRGSLVIIVLGAVVLLPIIPTPLIYRNDAWREADTASIARHFVNNGFRWLYPQIYWGGTGPGYVATEFPLYNLLVAWLYGLLGERLWLGRAVSWLFALLTFGVFYGLARRILERRGPVWALLFFVVSPLTLRYSVAYMPEAALGFFYVAGIYCFWRWMEEPRLSVLVLSAACVSLAVLIKPTALIVGVVIAPVLFDRWGWTALRKWELLVFAAITLVPGALWYYHAHQIFLQWGNTFGILEGDTKFGTPGYWLSPGFYFATGKLSLKWLLGGLGALLFVVGLYVAPRQRKYRLLVYGAVSILVYDVALARAVEKWYSVHYYLPALPFVALTVGLGTDYLLYQFPRRVLGIGLTIVSWLSILYLAGVFYADRVHPRFANVWAAGEIRCAASVASVVRESEHILVSSPVSMEEFGRPKNFQDPIVFFYARRYGWSLPLEQHTPAKLDEFRALGADYFVIFSQDLWARQPELGAYLASHAEQLGPGMDASCGIYRFK